LRPVALANKIAGMVWVLMNSGKRYREPVVVAAWISCAAGADDEAGKPFWAVHFECELTIGT
jgi:hypothetical protein